MLEPIFVSTSAVIFAISSVDKVLTSLPADFANASAALWIFISLKVIKPVREFTFASIFERCLIFLKNGLSNVLADQFLSPGTLPNNATAPSSMSPGNILKG